MADDGFGWRALNWAWERKDEILRLLGTIRGWFRGDGKPEAVPGILIIGTGGTGKTTLARLLSGSLDWLVEPPGEYAPSLNVECITLEGPPVAEVVVPPGQRHRRGTHWPDLLGALGAGEYRGIILVSAFGYQSLEFQSCKDHPLFKSRKDNFVPALLDEQRADELAVLDQVLTAAQIARGRLWMLTAVAKQDLWWPERQDAERFYRDGEYGKRITAAFGAHGSKDRRHEFCPVSLIIQNWATRAGERLRSNAEGYDQVMQINALRRMFETLDALRQWETET